MTMTMIAPDIHDPVALVRAYRARHPEGIVFDHDRDALRHYIIARRTQGASWKDIKQETSDGKANYYYIYYLQGISPRSVGGLCDTWPIEVTPELYAVREAQTGIGAARRGLTELRGVIGPKDDLNSAVMAAIEALDTVRDTLWQRFIAGEWEPRQAAPPVTSPARPASVPEPAGDRSAR